MFSRSKPILLRCFKKYYLNRTFKKTLVMGNTPITHNLSKTFQGIFTTQHFRSFHFTSSSFVHFRRKSASFARLRRIVYSLWHPGFSVTQGRREKEKKHYRKTSNFKLILSSMAGFTHSITTRLQKSRNWSRHFVGYSGRHSLLEKSSDNC